MSTIPSWLRVSGFWDLKYEPFMWLRLHYDPRCNAMVKIRSFRRLSFLTRRALSYASAVPLTGKTWGWGCHFGAVSVTHIGSSGGVVNSLDFWSASLKSLNCFHFRCILSSYWKEITVYKRSLQCQHWRVCLATSTNLLLCYRGLNSESGLR